MAVFSNWSLASERECIEAKSQLLMSKMSDEVMEEIDRVSHREGVHAL